MIKKNILFINGIEDNRDIQISKIDQTGNIQWQSRGSANLSNFLENEQFICSRITLDTTFDQELPRQKIHGVFNEIADPDSHKITLKKAEEFYKSISPEIPFFNVPSHVMRTTRDNIYKLLHGIDKLHVPKTVKIQPKCPQDIYEVIKKEGFSFPVIFRQAGDHNSISTIRIDDTNEKFYAFALDGRDYYLTQFVEYIQNSIYVKYRLIVVDGEVFLRHVYLSQDWAVHSTNQIDEKVSHPYQKDIAKRFLKDIKPLIQPVMTEIYHRLGLDYFGIDCNIDEDMNILVFEINPSMNVFLQTKNSMIFSKHIEKIRTALIDMLNKKV